MSIVLHLLTANKSSRVAKLAKPQIVHSEGGIAIGLEEQIARLLAHAISTVTCHEPPRLMPLFSESGLMQKEGSGVCHNLSRDSRFVLRSIGIRSTPQTQ